jgi:hypothetical protein
MSGKGSCYDNALVKSSRSHILFFLRDAESVGIDDAD